MLDTEAPQIRPWFQAVVCGGGAFCL